MGPKHQVPGTRAILEIDVIGHRRKVFTQPWNRLVVP